MSCRCSTTARVRRPLICDTDCTLLVIDQRRFLGVIDDVPAISHKLLSSLASKIRELDRQYYG